MAPKPKRELQNLNRGLPELAPVLFSGYDEKSAVPTDPLRPRSAWLRPVRVAPGVQSTYVVPGEWPSEEPDKWFIDGPLPGFWRKQNNVEYLIDGEPTYAAMVEAIQTATKPEHFIVLIGWTLHVDFQLSRSGARTEQATWNFLDVIKDRIPEGVRVRVLIWDSLDPEESPHVAHAHAQLNRLEPDGEASSREGPTGTKRLRFRPHRPWDDPKKAAVILLRDSGTRGIRGSHHQKVLLVYGDLGLIGFVGGVDFNTDRVKDGPKGAPLHDVHARVHGEAAEDLLLLATIRWNFSAPERHNQEFLLPGGKAATWGREIFDMTELLTYAQKNRVAAPLPHALVKVHQTVGNPRYRPKEEKNSILLSVRKALHQAKKFIYIEDQYLWSLEVMETLAIVAAKIEGHITILIAQDVDSTLVPLRRRAMQYLRAECAKQGADVERKIRVYCRKGRHHSYIHTKMYIVDDTVALIGSANCNNRGFRSDSEVNALFADHPWTEETSRWGAQWWRLELSFAHRLRMELWAEHLKLPTDELVDGLAAEAHWRKPPDEAEIEPYLIAETNGTWETAFYDGEWHLDTVIQEKFDPIPPGAPDRIPDPENPKGDHQRKA
jgi:phosphatidylserine/phosphatidylglycerophosphate/cardiolipin synthase-like enzyme